jgi:hypothetical protein
MALTFAGGRNGNISNDGNGDRKINEWFNVEELDISLMIALSE